MQENRKKTLTFHYFLSYSLAVLISSIFFGMLLAIYLVTSFKNPLSFNALFLISSLYSFPFFALGAFPISLYVDFSARIKSSSNWLKILIYASFSTLAGFIAVNIFDMMNSMFIFGLFGGIIYFYILRLLKKIIIC